MKSLIFIALALTVAGPAATAAYDAYLKIDGVDGGSEGKARGGWIDLLSVAQGMSRPMGDSGGGGASKPEFYDLLMVKPVDKATPLLMLAGAEGRHFPEATLDLVRADGSAARFYRIRLQDAVITQTEVMGNVFHEQPLETVALTYGYLEWSYVEFDLEGKEVAEHLAYWDLLQNQGGISVIPANGGPPPDPPDGFRHRVDFGVSTETGTGTLSWNSKSGKTYGVYYSPDLNEPFDTLVKTVPSEGDDTTSTTVELSGSRGFYIIREID